VGEGLMTAKNLRFMNVLRTGLNLQLYIHQQID
jgi:hypothetical protein